MLPEPTRDVTAHNNVGKGHDNTDQIGCYNLFPGTYNKETLQEVLPEEVRPVDHIYTRNDKNNELEYENDDDVHGAIEYDDPYNDVN